MDSVTTITYGQARKWNKREDAIAFFSDGVMYCDGCERERYAIVLCKLINGLKVCSDEEM